MLISEARATARQFCTNAKSSASYSTSQLDRAIQQVGNDFARRTGQLVLQSTIVIAANTNTIDLSTITNFLSRRLLRAWVDNQPPLHIVPNQEVLDDQRCRSMTGGFSPLEIGFVTPTSAAIWPTPTADTTINLLWHPPFTVWTPGAVLLPVAIASVGSGHVTAITIISSGGEYASAPAITITGGGGASAAATAVLSSPPDDKYRVVSATITNIGTGYTSAPTIGFGSGIVDATLNLSDDHMQGILSFGVPATLQHNEPEHKFAEASWAKYLEFVKLWQQGFSGASSSSKDSGQVGHYAAGNGEFIEGGSTFM